MKIIRALIALYGFLVIVPLSLFAEKIIVVTGKNNEPIRQSTVAPNLRKKQNNKGKWKETDKSILLPVLKKSSEDQKATSNQPNTMPTDHLGHLSKNATNVKTGKNTAKSESLDKVIEGSIENVSGSNEGPLPSTIKLTKPGQKTFTAEDDTTLSINPCLMTINGASMTVKIYDIDGSEISYSGNPLLEWSRENDVDPSPLKWKGQNQQNSIEEVSPGDYSPTRNLEYSIPIKKGQKIVVEVSGSPLSSNSIVLKTVN